MVSVNPVLIERLIPITIILTGIFNIYVISKNNENDRKVMFNYIISLGFGLIHGSVFPIILKLYWAMKKVLSNLYLLLILV
jgi:membrane protein insertase Oxa1/YidC/SpoIIIJ